jgi:tRNA pseudouridine38-40 synthase
LIKYKLVLSYDGTDYFGFQFQPTEVPTVELELRKVFVRLFQIVPRIIPAGRTDTGVHAREQVILVLLEKTVNPDNLKRALNSHLPSSIRVQFADYADENFHPRYSARSREYHYHFSNTPVPVFLERFITYYPFGFDFKQKESIKSLFLGEHNFKQFKNKGSFQSSDFKTIYKFDIVEQPVHIFGLNNYSYYILKIEASGFLYKMMRNIMGSLVEVLRGKKTVQDLQNLLAGADFFPYQTAPATGLFLMKVNFRGEE